MAQNPRQSTIVAVSGQPTKNLGATIINSGDTPAGVAGQNDPTNNSAGFGVLTGSNSSGKSSGSKVVERSGQKSHPSSGVTASLPGVQTVNDKTPFAEGSRAIAQGLINSADGQIKKPNVSWRNIFRQYPTNNAPTANYGVSQFEYGSWVNASTGGDTRGMKAVMRDERSEFGSCVQIGKRTGLGGGISISVGAPSGTSSRSTGGGSYYAGQNRDESGYVDSWAYEVHKMPSIPGEEGTLDANGHPAFQSERCSKWGNWGLEYYDCPGWLNGYERTGTRIFQTGESNRPRTTNDKRHGVTASGAAAGHSVAYNSDATRMAVGMPNADNEKGEVRVYQYYNDTTASGTPHSGRGMWHRIGGLITGNQKGDRFGYSVALDGTGDTLFVGAPRPKGSGYVSIQEFDGDAWAGAAGSSSGVSPGDRYGHAVTCNSAGTAYAVGAPWGSGSRGYAQVFANFGTWMTTRRGKYTTFRQSQQAAQDNGKAKVQRIVGTASGERLGFSLDMMYKSIPSTKAGKYNLRLAVGSPYWSSSVENFNFGRLDSRTAKDAGVPIVTAFHRHNYGKYANVGQPSGQINHFYYMNPFHPGLQEVGSCYDKLGLTSEGKVTVWGYSGASMTQTSKFAYSAFEFIQFGKSSTKDTMTGTHLSELGYSVKMSDDGDFVAAGAPGSDGAFDSNECKTIVQDNQDVYGEGAGGKSFEDVIDAQQDDLGVPNECADWGLFAAKEVASKDIQIGRGLVKCWRYLWKGSDGDAARKQHYRIEEDYYIGYGKTLRGGDISESAYPYFLENAPSKIVRNHRYRKPNFQHFGTAPGAQSYPTYQHGERFGTSVALFAEFAVGNVQYPHLVVGAPFALDPHHFNDECKMVDTAGYWNYDGFKEEDMGQVCKYIEWNGQSAASGADYYPYRTGRVDMFLGIPDEGARDNTMPMGAGANKSGSSIATSTFTKPKFEYLADGTKIQASGANADGGRESYFIAPNVSGSGMSNDNALKSSRKTFNSGGINFTSSD